MGVLVARAKRCNNNTCKQDSSLTGALLYSCAWQETGRHPSEQETHAAFGTKTTIKTGHVFGPTYGVQFGFLINMVGYTPWQQNREEQLHNMSPAYETKIMPMPQGATTPSYRTYTRYTQDCGRSAFHMTKTKQRQRSLLLFHWCSKVMGQCRGKCPVFPHSRHIFTPRLASSVRASSCPAM